MKKVIKTKIKEYRAKHDMKQDELAALVGVRRETIYHLEKGRYNPSLVLADSIAKVFGVTIEEMFEIVEEEALEESSTANIGQPPEAVAKI
jgi:putative transcriptional regulator